MTCIASDSPCKTAGDDFYYDVQYTESDGVTPIDLTGATALMELRDEATDPAVIITMGGGITVPENGQMRFTLTNADTALLLPRSEKSRTLKGSVKITYQDSTKETILSTSLTLEQEATE